MRPLFWLERLARKAIERVRQEGKGVVVCRAGQTPSGAKHIGNFNDNVRSYFVAKLVELEGFKARHVQTHDDMDPLRTIPRRLTDLDGRWHELDEQQVKELSKHVGKPLIAVPDPFGCCASWAKHFERVWEEGCKALGIRKTEYYSTAELYRQGKFNWYIERMFERIEQCRQIVLSLQPSKPLTYVPYWVICENCGKVSGCVLSFDLEAKTVSYECRQRLLAGKYEVESCKQRGTVSWEDGSGKLDWQFEWPAQMHLFDTAVEGFGKEHYEGSWQFCKRVLPEIYGGKPPIHFVYEFFLVDGKKMSSRLGNVLIVQDVLEVLEPEVFCFFYTKRPLKARDFDLRNLSLVQEFERAERIYFGLERGKDGKKEQQLKIAYQLSWCDRELPKRLPLRIPYRHAAVIAQSVANLEQAIEVLRKTGHLGAEFDRSEVLMKLKLAKNWVERYGPEELRIKVLEEMPSIELSEAQRKALRAVAALLKQEISVEELHSKLYEIARQHGLSSKEFFEAAYQLLLGKSSGPRLALLLACLDKQFLADRLTLRR